jgi:hypothetical protein
MQIFNLVLFLALARDDEKVRLVADVEIAFGKTGDGYPHAVAVLVASLDIIRRPAVGCLRRVFQQVEDAVETDARPIERGKVECGSHSYILH